MPNLRIISLFFLTQVPLRTLQRWKRLLEISLRTLTWCRHSSAYDLDRTKVLLADVVSLWLIFQQLQVQWKSCDLYLLSQFFLTVQYWLQSEQQLDCALDLMRRLPPQQIEKNLSDLIDLVSDFQHLFIYASRPYCKHLLRMRRFVKIVVLYSCLTSDSRFVWRFVVISWPAT